MCVGLKKMSEVFLGEKVYVYFAMEGWRMSIFLFFKEIISVCLFIHRAKVLKGYIPIC